MFQPFIAEVRGTEPSGALDAPEMTLSVPPSQQPVSDEGILLLSNFIELLAKWDDKERRDY